MPEHAVCDFESRGMWEELVDPISSIYGTFGRNNDLTGTLRSQRVSDGVSPTIALLFQQAGIVVEVPHLTSICSRFVFRKDWRGTRQPMKLLTHVYRKEYEIGTIRGYLVVEPKYEQIYLRLGYTLASEKYVVDPTAASPVRILTLDLLADTLCQRIAMGRK